jgi:hypothetical protein
MSWAKRNIYFLVSGIVAVGLLLAAGWYCYSSWQSNSANWDQLNEAYSKLRQLATKSPGPGNDTVNNIEAAKEQTKQVKERVAEMQKFFAPIRGIPDTNHFEDRVLASAVRGTVAQLRASAQSHNVALPATTPEFAFSFSLQVGKITYEPNSGSMLSKQLAEVKVICDTLFNCRIGMLESVQRERTSDDAASQGTTAPDYVDSISLTNNGVVITPYQVTFQCFTPELGSVLSSFANQSHTVVVKTVNIQPVDATYGGVGGEMGMQGGGLPVAPGGRGLPPAIDEKKLRVTMLLDFVKKVPATAQ